MQPMLKILSYATLGCFSLFWFFVPSQSVKAADACNGRSLIITGVQTSGVVSDSETTNFRHEFIEFYNCNNVVIDLSAYNLLVKDSTGDNTLQLPLAGNLAANEFSWALHNSYKNYLGNSAPSGTVFAKDNGNINALPANGGSVLLQNSSGTVIDEITYGVNELHAPIPVSGQFLKRCTIDGLFAATGKQVDDFILAKSTLSALFTLGPSCTAVDPQDPQLPQPQCDGLIISEIFPNPSGTDTGKEFIELFNPTNKELSLKGCTLRLGAAGKTFSLPSEMLSVGEYRIFTDSESGVSLPNKTAETVWLLSDTNEQGVHYADNLADEQSWIFIDNTWKASFKPTPRAANKLVESLEPGRGADKSEELKPCELGQERNVQTNRCRKIDGDEVAQACKPGQERNTETNRCRSVVSNTSLAACKPGQERNPETNRCRNTVSTNDLQPCAEGQERNPDTNRCRKVAATSGGGLNKIHDVYTPPATDPRWWLAGIAAVCIIGYGILQWRHDIVSGFVKLRNKISGPKPK